MFFCSLVKCDKKTALKIDYVKFFGFILVLKALKK